MKKRKKSHDTCNYQHTDGCLECETSSLEHYQPRPNASKNIDIGSLQEQASAWSKVYGLCMELGLEKCRPSKSPYTGEQIVCDFIKHLANKGVPKSCENCLSDINGGCFKRLACIDFSEWQPKNAIENKYHELLFQVCRKFPNESRHETALRYIKEAEERAMSFNPVCENKIAKSKSKKTKK